MPEASFSPGNQIHLPTEPRQSAKSKAAPPAEAAAAGQAAEVPDEAVQKVIELCNLDTYEKGEATIGDEVTYGDTTYTKIDVTTEWSDQTFYVAYAENGNNGDVGLVINFIVNNQQIDSADPLIGEVLESIKVVTK